MPSYTKIARGNAFKNHERFDAGVPMEGGKPPWSNTKFTVEGTIEPGVYSISMWQYSDTGNLSFEISKAQGGGDFD